jgi:LacI family transcriptional regulator
MRETKTHLKQGTTRRRRRPPAVTIHDVAASAGVSVATVSRVINGKEVVRADTSRRVRDAAKALRYTPNLAARSLSIQSTQTIGVVLPDVHGEFFSEVIRGVDVAARAAQYHIVLSGSHSDPVEMLSVLAAMRGRVDGLIVMAPDFPRPSLRDQLRGKIPLVLLNSTDGEHDAITIDNFGGARTMMRHLASLGHRRIAFVKGPATNADARERLRGYRQSVKAGGGERGLELEGDFGEASGYEAARALLEICGAVRLARFDGRRAKRPPPQPEMSGSETLPTAIFAANDSMAVGVLAALAEQGIAVPREMTVVGFDDIPIAHYVAPPLTTIAVDTAELGRRAFLLVREALVKSRHTPRQEKIPTKLVVRKSSAAPFISTRSHSLLHT